MRLTLVWVILCKELLETFRDRRTLIVMLAVPVLLYPLFAIGVSRFEGSEMEAREARSSSVAVWGELPADLERGFVETGKLTLMPWAGAPPELRRDLAAGTLHPPALRNQDAGENPEKDQTSRKNKEGLNSWTEPDNPVLLAARGVVMSREVEAVIVLWPDFAPALQGERKGTLSIYFDSVRADSMLAMERVERGVERGRAQLVSAREARHGLPPGFASAVDVLTRNVAPESRKVGQILGSMMPLLLIMMCLLGGLLPAIDLTAGEKERGTMQTLLCAPLRPIEIIGGKFLAVFSVSLLTALANLLSLALTLRRIFPSDIHVPPSAYALCFVLLIPVAFLFSAIFLALAVFAKDFKDGQNVLTPVYLPMTFLAGIAVLPGMELTAATAFAPVLNIALLIKALFLGEAAPELIFFTLLSSALYALLALLLAARVFQQQHVLLGGRESARALFSIQRRAGGEPTPSFVLVAFGAMLVLHFYGSLLLNRFGLAVQISAVQLGFFLAPAVLCVAAFGFSARDTLAIRSPSLRGAAGSMLLGVSAWVPAMTLARLLPPPESLAKALEKAMLLGGQPLWIVLVVVAVTPALCEETVFRGLVFSGLRRLGPAAAVFISALLFGFAHGSVYRILPTGFLGAVLGYARWQTGSIASGMIIHAINNGLILTVIFMKPPWANPFLEQGVLPWTVTLAGMVVFGLGLWFVRVPRAARSAP
jgi:sodium transport system permease protein